MSSARSEITRSTPKGTPDRTAAWAMAPPSISAAAAEKICRIAAFCPGPEMNWSPVAIRPLWTCSLPSTSSAARRRADCTAASGRKTVGLLLSPPVHR